MTKVLRAPMLSMSFPKKEANRIAPNAGKVISKGANLLTPKAGAMEFNPGANTAPTIMVNIEITNKVISPKRDNCIKPQ